MKISVIVALYNASDTIGRMLDGLLSQRFDDFEIIIIDDGSTDESGKICQSYADRDERVRVVHQRNSGVSAARQRGVDMARGEYIIHADADDYIEGEMLLKLYDKAVSEESDVVFCNYYSDSPDGSTCLMKQQPPKHATETLRAILTRLHGSCWNKLVRKSCLQKYNVRFPVGLDYCEDLLLWVQLFQHPEVSIAYLNEAFYHYVPNPSSITRNGNLKMLEKIRLFTKRITEVLPKGDEEIDAYIETLPIAPFQYAFQHKLISDKNTRMEYKRIRDVIWKDAKSLRWKLGYLMIDLNLMTLARKLIKL